MTTHCEIGAGAVGQNFSAAAQLSNRITVDQQSSITLTLLRDLIHTDGFAQLPQYQVYLCTILFSLTFHSIHTLSLTSSHISLYTLTSTN